MQLQVRMGGNVIYCGTVVAAKQAILSISETADLHAQQSLDCTHNLVKNTHKKLPVIDSSVCRNTLLMREVRGEWPDLFELTERLQ